MTSYEKIMIVANELHIPAYPDEISSDDEKYITFNYSYEDPDNFGDDQPNAIVGGLQLHLFLPKDENFFELRKTIRTKLFEQGFTYPSIEYNAIENDTDTRHIVFEFEDDEDADQL